MHLLSLCLSATVSGWLADMALPVCLSVHWADLTTERERQLTTGKRAERTARLPMLNLPLYHWSSQLFDLRAPSSIDVWVLLINQPIISYCKSVFYNFSKQTLV